MTLIDNAGARRLTQYGGVRHAVRVHPGHSTGPQLPTNRQVIDKRLSPPHRHSELAAIRALRQDPTISLCRIATAAPILLGEWSIDYKDTPDEIIEYVDNHILPNRMAWLEKIVYDCIDFGWSAHEKIYTLNDDMSLSVDLKQLRHEQTELLVDERTGALIGVYSHAPIIAATSITPVAMNMNKAALFAWDTEGTDWYGQSTSVKALDAQKSWQETEENAKRFDSKAAGAFWKIYYPRGVDEHTGKDNAEIADEIYQSIQSGGGINIPSDVQDYIDELNEGQRQKVWDVELISSKVGVRTPFTERQGYLDKLKIRAFAWTERALTEGTHGTKAEAESHTHLALQNVEIRHRQTTRAINQQLFQPILSINFGYHVARRVKINCGPIDDKIRRRLLELYKLILSDSREIDNIDTQQIRDELDIPSSEEPENGVRDTE